MSLGSDELVNGATRARFRDPTPDLFDAMSTARAAWLDALMPAYQGYAPVLLACQQMGGHLVVTSAPPLQECRFRVVRIGETTFDLGARQVDEHGRTVAGATSVVAVASMESLRVVPIPRWLRNRLRRYAR